MVYNQGTNKEYRIEGRTLIINERTDITKEELRRIWNSNPKLTTFKIMKSRTTPPRKKFWYGCGEPHVVQQNDIRSKIQKFIEKYPPPPKRIKILWKEL